MSSRAPPIGQVASTVILNVRDMIARMRSETRNQRDEIVQVLMSRLIVLRRAGTP
jgi:hypothetical protein